MKHLPAILLVIITSHWLDVLAASTKFSCIFSIGGQQQSFDVSTKKSQHIFGHWVDPWRLKTSRVYLSKAIDQTKTAFLLTSPSDDLVDLCYQQAASYITVDTLYFTRLAAIRAYSPANHQNTGHQVIARSNNKIELYYQNKTKKLQKDLRKFNFSVVLAGLVYRSAKLGKDGIVAVWRALKAAHIPTPKSIASIHVMGFGGVGGSYNLEELEESTKRGVTFLHSYHYDKNRTVYMDGTNPSKIVESDQNHGNIYSQSTVDKFIPDRDIQKLLKVDKSIAKRRYLAGDTSDFLKSVENLIDTPWPLLIHCKGGRHKTGMLAMVFEYLAHKAAMKQEYSEEIVIPVYKNRLVTWWKSGENNLVKALFSGPMYERHLLRPAEKNYALHNSAIFRQENIDFVRGLVSEELLYDGALTVHWRRIISKFKKKLSTLHRFSRYT